LEQALVWLPTLSWACCNTDPAEAGDVPTTLGTCVVVCVPDTVSCTFTVALTCAPPAGFWSSTVPTG
jgi:hypothetical protein